MSVIPGLLTTAEAAEIIGVSVASVRLYCEKRQLPCKRIGRLRLIPEQAVKSFVRPAVGNPVWIAAATRKKRRKPQRS